MKKSTIILLLLSFFKLTAQDNSQKILDSLNQIRDLELKRLADPATGKIPYEELEKAREEIAKRQATKQVNSAISPTLTWYERGPKDVGGSVRCIVEDPNQANGKKFWIGSANGGLWYNNDITDINSQWSQVAGGDNWASINISSIAFNPANTQEMYVATGDFFTFSSGVGTGIYKSTDGGLTFTRLTATIPNSSIIGTIGYAFQYINKLVINSQGHIFANTWSGVLKSTDGGASWTILLNSQIGSDLEIANDDIVYAAFGFGPNSSRIYRSTDASGSNWTDISPNTTGSRTEIALANSPNQSSQVLYAFAVDGTVKWFSKSTNGGTNWTGLSIPTGAGGSGDFVSYYGSALAMRVHPNNPNVVIAVGGAITKTIDGGTTWHTQNSYLSGVNAMIIGSDGNRLVFENARNINFDLNFGNQTATSGLNLTTRNKGLRIQSAGGVAMNNIRDEGIILGGGTKVGGALHSIGTVINNLGSTDSKCFIDQDNPDILISGALFNSNGSYITNLSNNSTYPVEYDSQNNIFYGLNNANPNSSTFDRVTNIGTTNNKSTFVINSFDLYAYPSFIRVAKAPNTIFVGTSNGKIYKISNLDFSPSVIGIANNQLPSNTNVSAIDIGTTDDEILVTFSNFGVSSVWYTNNGGTTWINKDDTGHGLPNIPVRHARFVPGNTPKVVLATELGVWSTNNITDSNPNWEPSNTGLPNIRCNWIYVRAADSVLAVATQGRGLFVSPMRGYLNPAIENQFNSQLLCKTGTSSVNFTTIGTFPNGTTFNIELSNSSGSFTSPTVIGSGTSSPISITIPSNLTSSSNYKLRIMSAGANPIISNESVAFSVRSNSESSIFLSNPNNISQTNGAYQFCNGANIGLYANLNINNNSNSLPYNWSGPNGFTASGYNVTISNASAASAGVYTISCNIESCQIYTATTQLSLANNLTVRAFGNSTVCPGGNVSLNSYPNIFTSTNPTYFWAGPNSFTSTAQFPNIANASVAASGVYTVTATFAGSCAGTATATTNVNITNTLPVSSSYSGSSCNGSTITLNSSINASTSGLTASYSWVGPNGFTSNVQSPTVSNFGASKVGVYTVTISYTGSCSGSNTSTVNLTLSNVNVNINGINQYCAGATTNVRGVLTFSNLSTQYTWSGPNGFSSSGDLLAIANLSSANAGIYTVTATYSGACTGTATNTTSITIVASPQAYITSSGGAYCEGASANLFAGYNIQPTSYSWTGPNNFSSTQQNPVIAGIDASKTGIYTLTETFGNGCNATLTATTNISLTNTVPEMFIGQRIGGNYCFDTGSIGLSINNNVGFSYTNINSVAWVGSNGFSSTTSNFSLSLASNNLNNSGTYTATISFIGCTATVTTTTRVSISTQPVVHSFIGGIYTQGMDIYSNKVANVCEGNNSFFDVVSNTGSSNTSYSWAGPNGFSSNTASNFFSVPQSASRAGIYTVTATQTGACAGTATSTVQLNFINSQIPEINITPQSFLVGQPVTLSSNCAGTVKWNFTSSTTNPITTTPTSGQSIFLSCNTNGCISGNSQRIIFNDCTSFLSLGSNMTNTISKYESINTITATNKIIPISNITYDAQRSVILSPGFEVQSGSVFKAQIDGCGNN